MGQWVVTGRVVNGRVVNGGFGSLFTSFIMMSVKRCTGRGLGDKALSYRRWKSQNTIKS